MKTGSLLEIGNTQTESLQIPDFSEYLSSNKHIIRGRQWQ